MSMQKMTDEEMEEVVGGAFTVDYTLNTYCPYHQCCHPGVQKTVESYSVNGSVYPTYFCPEAGRFYFEASNGYFNSDGNVLVEKVQTPQVIIY